MAWISSIVYCSLSARMLAVVLHIAPLHVMHCFLIERVMIVRCAVAWSSWPAASVGCIAGSTEQCNVSAIVS